MLRSRTRGRLRGIAAGRASAPGPDPTAGAVFDRRFDRSAGSLAGLAAARASPGYAENRDGAYWLFPEQTARRTDKGVLFEAEKTNRLYPSSVQGAVIGAPGALPPGWELTVPAGTAAEVVAVGTFGNIECVTVRVHGLATGGGLRLQPCATTAIAGVAGQTCVFSTFLHLTGNRGLDDLRVELRALDARRGTLALAQSDTLIGRAAAWSRPHTGLAALPAGSAHVVPAITSGQQSFDGGVPLDLQLTVGQPQVEDWFVAHTDAAAPSSPILTYDGPATRANEILRAGTDGMALAGAIAGAVIARSAPVARKSGTYVNFNNHALNGDWLTLRNSADATRLVLYNATDGIDSGVFPQADLPSPGSRFCAAFSMQGRHMALSVNGGATVTATSNAPLSTFAFVNLGSFWGGVDQIEGWIERVVIWNAPKSDADLPVLSNLATWGG
jgi:hypothetical protein